MAEQTNAGAKKPDKVTELIARYSALSDEDRRRFDRQYQKFRAVRNQFGDIFERMRGPRTGGEPAAPEKAK